MMKVNEIFTSIDGEGVTAGMPTTFIRFQGCSLNCSYCDTQYSRSVDQGEDIGVSDILDQIAKVGCKHITITGGEPLEQTDLLALLNLLYEEDYDVNIETNGQVDIAPYQFTNNMITMDYKLPSSGMEDRMNINNLTQLRQWDALKFVVGSKEDMDRVLELTPRIRELRENSPFTIYLSPVFGRIEPRELVEFIKQNELWEYRLSLQIHKVIWSPDTKGV